ncbi:MAG: hypothetical protein ACTSXP_02540 [Promethearchaeota archaeon]
MNTKENSSEKQEDQQNKRETYNKNKHFMNRRSNRKKKYRPRNIRPKFRQDGKKIIIFVKDPPVFLDDIIYSIYIEPIIKRINEGSVEEITFKASGKAINAAVRAAILLEDAMGVMKKNINISSQPANNREKTGNVDAKNMRMLSSIEINMKTF